MRRHEEQRTFTRETAEMPMILPSIHVCGVIAEMTCSVTRSCFSAVTLTMR